MYAICLIAYMFAPGPLTEHSSPAALTSSLSGEHASRGVLTCSMFERESHRALSSLFAQHTRSHATSQTAQTSLMYAICLIAYMFAPGPLAEHSSHAALTSSLSGEHASRGVLTHLMSERESPRALSSLFAQHARSHATSRTAQTSLMYAICLIAYMFAPGPLAEHSSLAALTSSLSGEHASRGVLTHSMSERESPRALSSLFAQHARSHTTSRAASETSLELVPEGEQCTPPILSHGQVASVVAEHFGSTFLPIRCICLQHIESCHSGRCGHASSCARRPLARRARR